MVPIHKQDKDREKAESYRPISLLSSIGKTMERKVNNRLTVFLEKNKILIDEQARKGLCTEHQTTLILKKIEDGFQEKDTQGLYRWTWKKPLI
ncbi:hypothetical protein ElyMa_004185300 [Elysia marginata]|uniref:Uncharacterized protein n=1 Tax=Elysia marginata TaxID=1093978 RepID=A0AAV4GN94_9GAST|nr:hypothetical protein ElyMa_004185300 [Elysia marginata]